MNDERVDRLFEDLDTALAVEPSPRVAARLRTYVRNAPAGNRRGMGELLMVAGAAAIVAAGYFSWPHKFAVSDPAGAVATQPAVVENRTSKPAGPVTMAQQRGTRPQRSASAPRPIARETQVEVIVSGDARTALEQLHAAVKEGRITSESFVVPRAVGPEAVLVTPVTIEVVKAEVVSISGVESTFQLRIGGLHRD